MRHLLAVEIFGYGKVGRGTQGPDDRKNAIALHQLPRLLHRLRRREGVVERYEGSLCGH